MSESSNSARGVSSPPEVACPRGGSGFRESQSGEEVKWRWDVIPRPKWSWKAWDLPLLKGLIFRHSVGQAQWITWPTVVLYRCLGEDWRSLPTGHQPGPHGQRELERHIRASPWAHLTLSPDLHYPSSPKTNPANFGEFLYRFIVRNVKTETDIKKRMEVTYSLTILRQPYWHHSMFIPDM